MKKFILIIALLIISFGIQAKNTVRLDSVISKTIDAVISQSNEMNNKTIYTHNQEICISIFSKKSKLSIIIKDQKNVIIKIKYNHKSNIVSGYISSGYSDMEVINLLNQVLNVYFKTIKKTKKPPIIISGFFFL